MIIKKELLLMFIKKASINYISFLILILVSIFFFTNKVFANSNLNFPEEAMGWTMVGVVFMSPEGETYVLSKNNKLSNEIRKIGLIDSAKEFGSDAIDKSKNLTSAVVSKTSNLGVAAFNTVFEKIDSMFEFLGEINLGIGDLKQKINDARGFIGLIVLIIGSAMLTFLINTSIPILPKNIVFYCSSIITSIAWLYVTSNYKSLFYLWTILCLPLILTVIGRYTFNKVKAS